MSSIKAKINALIEELGSIDDVDDRFVYLIECAQGAKEYPEKYREDLFRVPGCLSHLWIHPYCEGDFCYFEVDSDAQIPKGIAVVLSSIFSGERAQDIIDCDLSFTEDLGISNFLSPNRRNSLSHICNYIRAYAEQVAMPKPSVANA